MSETTEQQTETTTAAAERLGERGANLVEYALLMALLVIVCIAGVRSLGSTTAEPYSKLDAGIVNGS